MCEECSGCCSTQRVDGWMDGTGAVWRVAVVLEVWGWGREPVELHSLQLVKELSGLQRSTVCFTSSPEQLQPVRSVERKQVSLVLKVFTLFPQ